MLPQYSTSYKAINYLFRAPLTELCFRNEPLRTELIDVDQHTKWISSLVTCPISKAAHNIFL